MIDYEVGQIPNKNLGITVKDERDNTMSLLGYQNISAEILGPDGEDLDLTGLQVVDINTVPGTVAVIFPRNRSLFEKSGTYLIRLRLSKDDGTLDYTRAVKIIVRDFGRFNN